MFRLLRDSFSLLSEEEGREFRILVLTMIVMGLVEVAGIASLGPFLAIASDESIVTSNQTLNYFYELLGLGMNQFLLVAGIAVFVMMILANLLSAFTLWKTLRFSWMRNHSISLRLLEQYLGQPYVFFLNRNSSDLAKNLFSEVQQVVTGIMISAANMIARIISTIFIGVFLIYLDPVLAVATALALGGAYSLIYLAVRRKLQVNGIKRLETNTQRYKVASEAFGGIKDVKILGRESVFVRDFEKASRAFAQFQADQQVISQLPRFLLEIIAFGGMLGVLLYLLSTEQTITQIIPLLGLYAFAGYRLMPAVRQIFVGTTSIRYNAHALEVLYSDISKTVPLVKNQPRGEKLPLQRAIRFKDVTFQYPEASRPTINAVSLEIQARTTVAFVGSTGCGKTTSIDLLLGLLMPQSGTVEVDDVDIRDKLRAWQDNVGYVSQHIYLADDSIAANIAFGIPKDKIDFTAVKQAAEIAAIHDFIEGELDEGYSTLVGERGVRLSGGQRQRIGIARALYNNPDLLVFDEATSALDNVTEDAILNSITRLSGEKTIIMIAHRLSTVRHCDQIFVMRAGNLVGSGTYDELLTGNIEFQKLVSGEVEKAA